MANSSMINPQKILSQRSTQRNLAFLRGFERIKVFSFNIATGIIDQTRQGDFSTAGNFSENTEWSRLFTNRNVVTARLDTAVKNKKGELGLDFYMDAQGRTANFTPLNRGVEFDISNDINIFNFHTWRDLNPAQRSNVLTKFYLIPQLAGNELFYISAFDDYNVPDQGKSRTFGVAVTFSLVSNLLSNLEDNRFKQFIHFGGPSESYLLPFYNEATKLWETQTITPPKPTSIQIDIIGLGALGGVLMTSGTTQTIVPDKPIQPFNDLFEIINSPNQEYTYLIDSGPELLGTWNDYQSNVKSQYSLNERPNYEGVLVSNEELDNEDVINQTGVFTIVGTLPNGNTALFIGRVFTPSTGGGGGSIAGIGNLGTYTFYWTTDGRNVVKFSKAESDEQLALLNQNIVNNFRQEFILNGLPGELTAQPTNIFAEEDTTTTNTLNAFLFGETPIDMKMQNNISTPNILISRTTNYTFTQFLAVNSIANLDTINLPVEISENIPVSLSDIPIFGRLLNVLTLGIPVGFNIQKQNGYYNRKYNWLIPKQANKLMTEGVYGKKKYLSLDLLKNPANQPFLSEKGFSSSYRFSFADSTTGSNRPATLTSITELTEAVKLIDIQTLGFVDLRITFLQGENKVWQTYVESSAKYNEDIRRMHTFIRFSTEGGA